MSDALSTLLDNVVADGDGGGGAMSKLRNKRVLGGGGDDIDFTRVSAQKKVVRQF